MWSMWRNGLYAAVLMVAMGSCNTPAEGDQETNGAQPRVHTVEIGQMKFTPAEIIVQKGDKVMFVNHDMVAHDITEASAKAWSSSILPADESWTLDVTQSADYYCTLHPVMKGKIIVQ